MYMQRVGESILLSWGWLLLAPAIICLLWGIMADWRWAVVGLALICIVVPGALCLAYIYYMMSPQARRAVYPRQVQVTDQGVTFHYLPLTDDGPVMAPLTLPYASLRRISRASKAVYLIYGSGRGDFEVIPRTACTPEQWAQLMLRLPVTQ